MVRLENMIFAGSQQKISKFYPYPFPTTHFPPTPLSLSFVHQQQQIHRRLSSSPPLPLATTNGADACGSAAGSPAFSRRGATQLGSSLSR